MSIRPMTAISPMNNIYEDICASTERERAEIIILPFHKHQRFDGALETTRTEFRSVNRKVLEHASCSVRIFVDRGLGGSTQDSASNVCLTLTILFFGGCDDHEAVAYGARMAEHPGNSLTVIHFLASPEIVGGIVEVNVGDGDGSKTSSGIGDEKLLAEFNQKILNNYSIKFEARFVRDAAETIDTVREVGRCSLFLVGRVPEGQVAASLNVKSDCSELGPVGSLLASSDFSTSASVLVVQQYHS